MIYVTQVIGLHFNVLFIHASYAPLINSLVLNVKAVLICAPLLKETLTNSTNNRSTVFCSFLDASKAFDRVQYCIVSCTSRS